jgi:carbonic anhydrase/acetyltransferase-like protein (isoleucine patch superfamily)
MSPKIDQTQYVFLSAVLSGKAHVQLGVHLIKQLSIDTDRLEEQWV